MKITPITTNAIAISFGKRDFMLISSFIIFGKYTVIIDARMKTNNGRRVLLNALTSEAGPFQVAYPIVMKAE